jgi:hypothetical protein
MREDGQNMTATCRIQHEVNVQKVICMTENYNLWSIIGQWGKFCQNNSLFIFLIVVLCHYW